MRNITLTCPACGEHERCVGDPNETDAGHSGEWFCFNCKSHGNYAIAFEQTGDAPTDPATEADPAAPDAGTDA